MYTKQNVLVALLIILAKDGCVCVVLVVAAEMAVAVVVVVVVVAEVVVW